MSAATVVHVVVSGLATGAIYALMALSLVIIYNATRTLNFAQGEMLMMSTFVAWSAQRALGLPLVLTLVVAILAGGALAWLVERAIIRRAIAGTHWDVLIITVGLSLILRAAAGLAWTHDEFPFPSFFPSAPLPARARAIARPSRTAPPVTRTVRPRSSIGLTDSIRRAERRPRTSRPARSAASAPSGCGQQPEGARTPRPPSRRPDAIRRR